MGRNVSNTSFINFQQKLKHLKIISFLRLRPGSGGGEPQQPGAVCGGAGCQLRLHGLPQCDAEGDSGSGSLRRAAHHLSAGRHRTFPPTLLFPLPRPTQVCDSLCMFSKISWSRFHLQVRSKKFFLFFCTGNWGMICRPPLCSSVFYLNPLLWPQSTYAGRQDSALPNRQVAHSTTPHLPRFLEIEEGRTRQKTQLGTHTCCFLRNEPQLNFSFGFFSSLLITLGKFQIY